MSIRTEAQITQNWKYQDSPLVSIVCVTYNHEPYITDAIESFLMQETDFPFEIIIQDDASTDKTPLIIKQYTEKFPTIIKPIFHRQNQFSKNWRNVLLTVIPHLKGQYIAICDGDDFWTDPKKLHTQIDEMKKNTTCDISFHPGIYRSSDPKTPDVIFSKHSEHDKIFTPSEIITGGGGFCLTPSLVIKKKIFDSLPSWFQEVEAGDYFLQMLASLNGGALYINKIMSVYRGNTPESWSEKIARDENYFHHFYTTLLKSLEHINMYTKYEYQNEFNLMKANMAFYMCKSITLSPHKRKQTYETYKSLFTKKQKIIWHLLFRNEKISTLAYSIKKNILGH